MEFKSDAFEAIYEAAVGLYRVGTIDETEMKTFDEMCLVVEEEDTNKSGDF